MQKNATMSMRKAALFTLCFVLLAGVRATAVSEPLTATPRAQSFRLGGAQFVALRDAQNIVDNDGKVFGVGVGTAAVAAVLKNAGRPTGKVTLPVDALLVKMHGRVMLFDTGLGPGVHGALIGSLARAGVPAADVTDIFITHSHGDHVGGLVSAEGRPAFPRAVVHMSAREWTHMQSEPESRAIVKVVRSQIVPFTPGVGVAPGVTAVALYGHTPGHVGYQITPHGEKLIDVGDVAHSSIVSLAKPDWANGYDDDKKTGSATRRAILTRLAATHEWVFFPHFPFPGVGKIAKAGTGFAWKPGLP